MGDAGENAFIESFCDFEELDSNGNALDQSQDFEIPDEVFVLGRLLVPQGLSSMPINTLGECPKGWTTTQFVVVVDLGDRNRALWLVLVRELGPEVEEDEYYGSYLSTGPKVEMGWEECKKALGQTCSQLETVLPISRTNAGEEPKIFDCACLTEIFGDWCSGTASTMAQQIRKTAGARNPQLFRTPGEDILLRKHLMLGS